MGSEVTAAANVFVGAGADVSSSSAQYAIAIGYGTVALPHQTVIGTRQTTNTTIPGGTLTVASTITATNGYYFPQQSSAPTAASIGGTVGSVTNHLMLNVNGLLIDYWSDGTTLYSKQLAP